jgi:HD superfamily phosphohydrolase
MSDYEKKLTCSTAQGHDFGHFDFSHAVEKVAGIHHEVNTVDIFLGTCPRFPVPQVPHLLSDHGVNPQDAADVITGTSKYPLVQSIISNPVLDVDRLDFLSRDKHMTGADIGTIELDRLIQTAVVDDEGKLGISKHGIRSLRQFLLARLNMYEGVYLHPVTASAEAVLRHAIKESLDVARPFMWGDDALLYRLENLGSEESKKCARLLRRSYRELPKLATELHDGHTIDDALREVHAFLKKNPLSGDPCVFVERIAAKPAGPIPSFKVESDGQFIELAEFDPICRFLMTPQPRTASTRIYVGVWPDSASCDAPVDLDSLIAEKLSDA